MDHEVTCVVDGCENSYKAHEWGNKKAQRDGWFLQKDGSRYCPEHVPEWVGPWRERQKLNGR